MWSDEINKKIDEAEGSKNSSYNDKAWENMELLLDKHLPLKKKRRRFIFLLFPLILGGAATFFILQNRDKKVDPIIQQKNIPAQTSATPVDNNQPALNDKLPETNSGTPIIKKNEPSRPALKKITTAGQPSPQKSAETKTPVQFNASGKKLTVARQTEKAIPSQPDLVKKSVKKIKENNQNITPGQPIAVDALVIVDNSTPSDPVNPIAVDTSIQKLTAANDDKKKQDSVLRETAKSGVSKQEGKSAITGKLSLNLSFGPDVSSVGIDNPGTVEMQYGIGLAYAFSKRITVRTGFFAGVKKYTADSADYHLHYSIANLQKVDADCYVYEIPLTVIYNFPTRKKHNWFVSGGVSSYLMKKETYDYYYKNSWGQSQSYSRTYKNESSHLFSVINLSGGYQYHLSDRLSLLAEPYIKIPANGIGMGKVNLNNAGMLFTIGFKPFFKNN